MHDGYYARVCEYKQIMLLAKAMLRQGIISAKDYAQIDKIIARKKGINSCSLYREIP
ncbi:SHOCT domain-containing protein [Ructibacterium gallinarum]|uniref:SHOCT-like domain-containing protein n=1 Tax=Ructibacterium gallinarum TaxID=2779355 RepID=A0A9D5M5A6_9FIRM|nr:SHOCT domain-containing protein [Ructibacterium gallinarum]MBE5039799.1 hypothetical protein [Ructibacterium gallinarum]DAY68425.1 MAG TPA: hypothetical protein [Caudoviricetes sp.]